MKILMTGATGFVGKHLCEALSKENEIFTLTRESSDTSMINPDRNFIFKGEIEPLIKFIRGHEIVGVIHLATYFVAEHKSSQIKDIIKSNIFLGTAVLEAAVNAGCEWFINTGTIWQNYNVPDFSDEYNPVNLYAASKQAFITMAKYFTEVYPIRFTTLKLCDTYGSNDSRRKIMDLFAQIAKTGETLEMSKGEQLIDIVPIEKVITEFKKLISKVANGEDLIKEEYVVSSGSQISLKDLAREYETKNKVKLNIKWGARPYRKREVMKPYIGNQI